MLVRRSFPTSATKSEALSSFVEQNRDELARLVGFPGVENVPIDFGIEQRDVAAQNGRFPPHLLGMLEAVAKLLRRPLDSATYAGGKGVLQPVLGDLGIALEFTLSRCRVIQPV